MSNDSVDEENYEDCDECAGSGDAVCYDCSGDGCEKCDQTGLIECGECDGVGEFLVED